MHELNSKEVVEVINLLNEYLQFNSLDGNPKRHTLRVKMKKLLKLRLTKFEELSLT